MAEKHDEKQDEAAPLAGFTGKNAAKRLTPYGKPRPEDNSATPSRQANTLEQERPATVPPGISLRKADTGYRKTLPFTRIRRATRKGDRRDTGRRESR